MDFPLLDFSLLDNLDVPAKLIIWVAIIVILIMFEAGDVFESLKRRFRGK